MADSTGRLTEGLGWRSRALLFGASPDEVVDELMLISQIDKAHIVMLVRQNLLSPAAGGALVRLIVTLRQNAFRQLLDLPRPRGTYLMYETYLSECLGEHIGGMLHTGRSRNDLKATATALQLRAWLLEFLAEAGRMEAVLLSRARAHRAVIMPAYTHFQAAMPITYGHYLLGTAFALGRDIDAVQQAGMGARRCPMGASAVAGTTLPLDPDLVATLLGFEGGPWHAGDAVASRDVMLRTLAAVAGLGLTISRLATDLQLWSTEEFGLVRFPDRLVGGSSAMPQKRNAFLLEHLKAKVGAAIGAWSGAAAMMASTPFTNTIEVGTEAVAVMWPGLRESLRTVQLAQLVVSGARPVPARMSERARRGFTTATASAEQLVLAGVPFRAAHRAVGEAVRRAIETGAANIGETRLADGSTFAAPAAADPGAVAAVTRVGGGPGMFDNAFAVAHADAARRAAQLRRWRDSVAEASEDLQAAADGLMEHSREVP